MQTWTTNDRLLVFGWEIIDKQDKRHLIHRSTCTWRTGYRWLVRRLWVFFFRQLFKWGTNIPQSVNQQSVHHSSTRAPVTVCKLVDWQSSGWLAHYLQCGKPTIFSSVHQQSSAQGGGGAVKMLSLTCERGDHTTWTRNMARHISCPGCVLNMWTSEWWETQVDALFLNNCRARCRPSSHDSTRIGQWSDKSTIFRLVSQQSSGWLANNLQVD